MDGGPGIALIGAGNMGGAILDGCLRGAGPGAGAWAVADPDERKRNDLAARGVAGFPTARAAVEATGPDATVLLAVKPQALDAVAADLGGAAGERVVVSVLAGATSERVRAALGGRCRVIRAMPNTPARIGRGVSAVAPGAGARPGDEARASELLGAVGDVVELTEDLIDAFTAVAGSGPAYLFRLAEAMRDGAGRVGLPPDVSARAVLGTLAGACALLDASGDDPGALRRAVTSPGGTTEAALRVIEARGAPEAVAEAIVAARDRGRELGSGA